MAHHLDAKPRDLKRTVPHDLSFVLKSLIHNFDSGYYRIYNSMDKVDGFEMFSARGFLESTDILTPEEANIAYKEFIKYSQLYAEENGKLEGDKRFMLHLVANWASNIVYHEKLLRKVKELLKNENILCWSSDINIKYANSSGFFSWHQDSTYAGLEPVDQVVTAWVALTRTTRQNGCLCFLPESHPKQLQHRETHCVDNMLSLGQTITDEQFIQQRIHKIVYSELQPGQASFHSFRCVHSSGSNQTEEPRIGLAIRYMTTNVHKVNPIVKERISLVSGCYHGDAFEIEPRLNDEDEYSTEAWNEHRISMELERRNYFSDTGKTFK